MMQDYIWMGLAVIASIELYGGFREDDEGRVCMGVMLLIGTILAY